MNRLSIALSAALLLSASAVSAAPAGVGEAAGYPGDDAVKGASLTRAEVRDRLSRPDTVTPYVFGNNEGVLIANPAYRAVRQPALVKAAVQADGPYYMN